jgi:bifunctional ADP-heptose synthase (sugar kinase/adenylyltransferase)
VDTRTKILGAQAAAEAVRNRQLGGAPVKLVTGYFDPLLAAHARRLSQLASGATLVAVVADPSKPILPARARAELVAALSVVDYVVLAADAARAELFDCVPPGAIFYEESEDEHRVQELIEHVRSRHNAS